MAGVTDQTITLPVSAGQYSILEHDRVRPGAPRVTHKIALGPHYLPGTWVVVGTLQRMEPPDTTHWVTIARVEE